MTSFVLEDAQHDLQIARPMLMPLHKEETCRVLVPR